MNARPSDKAMEALRLDFARDGVMAKESVIEALYGEACKGGYRPACGWKAWHPDTGADLTLATEVFAPLCARRDAMACVVVGWGFEAKAEEADSDSDRERAYVKAAKQYKVACDTAGRKGIAGCFELAQMRANGRGMPVSTQLAYDLHEWACSAGYGLSCVGLAHLMPQEFVPSVDESGAETYPTGSAAGLYRKACDLDVARGCFHLGTLAKDTWPLETRRAWFDGLCVSGANEACLALSDLHEGVTPEALEGRVDALTRGCALGGGEACYRLGKGNEHGEFGVPNISMAAASYKDGCNKGNGQACGAYGRLVADGVIGSDRSVAERYLEQGCAGGVVSSCVLLGDMYIQGEWVEKDSVRALKLLLPGCIDGELVFPRACKGIASLYSEGSGVTRNRVEAARYLGISCDMGDLESCYLQGEQYRQLRGDERYDDIALLAYKKACAGKVIEACVAGGLILEQGALKLRDAKASVGLYQQACDAGAASGCLALGSLLERGNGMDSDFPGARASYMRGMELGNVESQRRYARMLWHGLGGKKRRGQARRHYQDACMKGLSKACAGWRL